MTELRAQRAAEVVGPASPRSSDLLEAARAGRTEAFEALSEPHRHELLVHCYRILGSLTEAEDMVQESFLRAWKRLSAFEGRSTFRAWLYKIATNACLDVLDKRDTRRVLPEAAFPEADPLQPVSAPLPDIPWLEPFPDELLGDQAAENPEARYSAHESISLAFLAALQGLPARQRAVLILSDVLDWSARETAQLLGVSASAVASALHRARLKMARTYHGLAAQDRGSLQTDARTRDLLNQYMLAWEQADVDGLVRLLRDDAVLSMPPSPTWYRGRSAIGIFAATTVLAEAGPFRGQAAGRWRLLPTRANGQPAAAVYIRGEGAEWLPFGIHVLEAEGSGLRRVTCFITPDLVRRFGLPAKLSG